MEIATTAPRVPIGELIAATARRDPGRVALRIVGQAGPPVTYRDLDRLSRCWARSLQRRGAGDRTAVGIALPPSVAFVAATLGALHIGSTVFGLSPDDATVASAVGAVSGDLLLITEDDADDAGPSCRSGPIELPPHPNPRTASLTGGTTTGEPRLVRRPDPWTYDPVHRVTADDRAIGRRLGQVQLVALPLHHSGFTCVLGGLALDHEILLMPRFDAHHFANTVIERRVNFMRLVPTIMSAVAALPGFDRFDFAAVESVCHGSAVCSHDVKMAWIDLVGAERVIEGYASAERLGAVFIRGDEWLNHRGSVGRPLRVGEPPRPPTNAVVRVIDDESGLDCRPGEEGTIYMNIAGGGAPRFLSEGSLDEIDGLYSVGDRGHLDEAGYLYLTGRSTEWINVGGSSVNLGRVEQIVSTIPGVRDAEAYGIPDPLFGSIVGLNLVTSAGTDDHLVAIKRRCRDLLTDPERPVKFNVVPSLEYTSTGKLSRRGR